MSSNTSTPWKNILNKSTLTQSSVPAALPIFEWSTSVKFTYTIQWVSKDEAATIWPVLFRRMSPSNCTKSVSWPVVGLTVVWLMARRISSLDNASIRTSSNFHSSRRFWDIQPSGKLSMIEQKSKGIISTLGLKGRFRPALSKVSNKLGAADVDSAVFFRLDGSSGRSAIMGILQSLTKINAVRVH